MNNEKLCEYLSEKGVLLFDNIDLFFQVYSSNNNKQFKNEPEKLKESLFLYLEKTTKDENLLRLMSNQIIESYYNSETLTKYKTIKNLVNILQSKLLLNYTNFIFNISRNIINKNKAKKSSNQNGSNIEEIKGKSLDDNDASNPQEQTQSEKQSKPKKKKSKPKKKPQRPNMTNLYKNNYYRNIQDNIGNPYSYFVNNNDYNHLNIYNNDFPNNYQTNPDDNNIKMRYNNIRTNKYFPQTDNYQLNRPINNYMMNATNNLLMNMNDNNINFNYNNNINYINNNYDYQGMPSENNIISQTISGNPMYENQDVYDFLNNEKKHMEKVQTKIMNLKNERITQLEEQCTFTPKINVYNKYSKNKNIRNNPVNSINNISSHLSNNTNSIRVEDGNSYLGKYPTQKTFEKLYRDSSINKKKKEERIKKYLGEFKFAPEIEINEKYPVKSSFEERRKKSIDVRNKYKNQIEEKKKREMSAKKSNKMNENEKKIIKRLYDREMDRIKEKRISEKKLKEKEEKKKHVIDWKKVYKNYNEKYPDGDNYKRHLEKRKKFMESSNNVNNKDNNVKEFSDFLKEKKYINNIDNNNSDKERKEEENKDNEVINNNINKENNMNDDNKDVTNNSEMKDSLFHGFNNEVNFESK